MLGIQPMVAANACDVLVGRSGVAHRSAGDEHSRAVLSELACDTTADPEGTARDNRDAAL